MGIDVKLPELGFSGPKLSGDSKVSTFDANLPNVAGDVKLDISPPVVAEEKSSKFSFGFGKKGKKKKEKSPQLPTADPVVADLSLPDITLKGKSETSVDVPPPKPPRLDTNLDSNASLLVSGTDIGVDSPSTIIPGSEISVSLTDGKVVPNIGSETKIDLPSLSLEKDTDRSLVPKMGLSAKLSKADIEGQGPKTEDHLEIPSVDTPSESHELEKKSSFSFGFGSKRDKKKKEKEPSSPDATVDVNIDATLPDVDGNGLMKNWYKEKSPSKDKKKSGGLSLGFGSKNKETPDVEVKQPDLGVPQEVNLKKKGSFLGGLIKKGSKAKDVEDVSLKYKGKLKDNNEDIDVKANLEGDAKGVAMDVDLPSVALKGPEISNGGTTRGFKLFNDAPDHKDGTTGIAVNGKAPKATLDTDASGGEMEIELPSVGLKVDVPKVDLSLPKTKSEAEVAITVTDPNLPALEIEKPDTNLPEVDIKAPSVEVDVKK